MHPMFRGPIPPMLSCAPTAAMPAPLSAVAAHPRGAMRAEDPLITRAQAGETKALDELFRRHREDVARIAFRFIGPGPDLDDVVQESFIQVYRSIGTFKGNSRFSTWLYRVVSNVAKMHIRAKRSRPQLASAVAQEIPRPDSDRAGPEDAAARSQRVERLYAHIHRLPEKKRTVLLMHDFDGVAPKRIAEVVGIPLQTVRTRLFYARKELYGALARDEELRDLMAEGARGVPPAREAERDAPISSETTPEESP